MKKTIWLGVILGLIIIAGLVYINQKNQPAVEAPAAVTEEAVVEKTWDQSVDWQEAGAEK